MKILAFTVLSLFATLAIAADASWQGYRQIEDTGLSFSDVIQKTTVRLTHVGGVSTKESDFKIVDTDSRKVVTDEKKLDSEIELFQIETCRRQNLKKCPVVGFTSSSTGIIEDGSILHTCRHGLHNWLYMATKHNSVSITAIFPPMIIRDYKGVVRYNSAYSTSTQKIDFINEEPKLNRYFTGDDPDTDRQIYFSISDYVAFTFDSPIVEPTSITINNTILPTDLVYLSGYPGKTKKFGGVKKGDAPGKTLVASSGKLIEMNAAGFKSTNFVASGNSGGPALNQNGELLGIVTSGDEFSMILSIDRSLFESNWRDALSLLK